MKISDLIARSPIPVPWEEGDNIPWNDPAFSERMLEEHLTQEHDAASRRTEVIEEHVHWIHDYLLAEQPSRILDLGCGPGLYANRLTQMGHSLTGVDFSPASIRYARQQAEKDGLNIEYIESDIRQADYGGPYDLAMLIFGEFNVFRPADAALILEKMHSALKPGGMLLLEPQNLSAIQRAKSEPPIWRSYHKGLFSDRPHLFLHEYFYDGRSQTVTTRYWVIDAETAEVTRYAQTAQGYVDGDLEGLLQRQGFEQVTFYPALAPKESEARQEFFGLTAVRREI
jgi:SAM-dependent methyltransferase